MSTMLVWKKLKTSMNVCDRAYSITVVYVRTYLTRRVEVVLLSLLEVVIGCSEDKAVCNGSVIKIFHSHLRSSNIGPLFSVSMIYAPNTKKNV